MFELMPMTRRMPIYRPAHEFDDFFPGMSKAMMNAFNTDIIDTGDAFELNAELPGFKKEDIKISVEKDFLTISAERKQEENEEKPNFVKRERFYGSYSRSFDLSGINTEAISAAYNNGVLTLILPKIKEEAPASRQIEIN